MRIVVAAAADVLARWPDPWSAVSAAEVERARDFHRADDARDFLAAHLAARECVTALTGASPVRLVQRCAECGGPHGKPSVPEHPEIHVSWSHSHGHIAAVAARDPVGIDVETRGRRHDVDRLVRRTATSAEAAAILADSDPGAAYLRMWVAKEALVKVGAVTVAQFGRTDVRDGVYGDVALAVTEPPGVVVGLAVRQADAAVRA
ncbi:MAG TPA: 4'-phosphopantetheinyl transferase superfamily protein [Mycobacteriales bacterium]